jgi:hypothetical protein
MVFCGRIEGLKVRRGRGVGNFTNFFLKFLNFGCVGGRKFLLLMC